MMRVFKKKKLGSVIFQKKKKKTPERKDVG